MGREDKVVDWQPYYNLNVFTIDSHLPGAYSKLSGFTVENIHGWLPALGSVIPGGL